MMGRRADRRIATAILVVLLGAGATIAGQRGGALVPAELPPVSMTCPMHPDVVESSPGTCPLCRMNLVPVRIDTAWMCPLHTMVMEHDEGTCRICRRQLVRVSVALTWTCLGQPGIDRLEPGICPDGSIMVPRRTLRPHGNHNPQHGGQFFMAPDNWHHLEGTYPANRVFRLYVYDDFARPLPPAEMQRLQARVVTIERFDPVTRQTTEIRAFPMRVSRDGSYLEADVDTTVFPVELTAKIRIKPESPEYRFDFTFPGLTREPVTPAGRGTTASPASAATASPASQAPAAGSPAPRAQAAVPDSSTLESGRTPQGAADQGVSTSAAGEPAAAEAAAAVAAEAGRSASAREASGEPIDLANVLPNGLSDVDAVLAPLQIPETIAGIVEELQVRDERIRDFIRQGNFGAVWVPAFHAKDLAIALEPHLGHLAPGARESAEPALQQVVRFAWLLDAFGDSGNRLQLERAYAEFARAVAVVVEAFGTLDLALHGDRDTRTAAPGAVAPGVVQASEAAPRADETGPDRPLRRTPVRGWRGTRYA